MEGFFDRLAQLQHRRAGVIALVAFLLAGAAVPLIADLGLDSSWTALLPEDKPSVRDLEEIGDRVGGLSTLTVGIASGDLEAMQAFARDIVPRLERLQEHSVRSVDWNIASYEDFVYGHRHLYATLSDLEEIRDSLQERLDYERNKANPFYVDLEDEEPPDADELLARMRARADEGREKLDRYPGGFYVHPDRDFLAIFVRSDITGGDAAGAARLIAAIDGEVEDLDPSSYAADMTVEYGGSLVVAREEHDAIAKELVLATAITIALVLLAIWIFFRKVRAIAMLGAALIPPVLITFGFAELAVDYLNTSTAFLGSIVIGNGVNPNIIWLARYFEERRAGREVLESLRRAHRGTWLATATASLAAAIAYGSLVITDFRGFRDFGIIGGIGMVLCWIGAIALLPAITALLERFWPLRWKESRPRRNLYGLLFSVSVRRFPRAIIVLSALLGLASLAVIGQAIADDPLEYDFRRLKSVREGTTRARAINRRVGEIVGGSEEGTAIAMVFPSRGSAQALEREMEAEREADPGVAYGKVSSADDLLPKEQEAKIPVLAEMRETLLDLRRFADAEQREQIDEHLPPEDVTALTLADLPEDVARSFTERDGTRGRILFVDRRPEANIWNGRFLVEWSEALRAFRLEDGTRPPLAGRAPVFADMIEAIWSNSPKAIAASFIATLLLVLLTFRQTRQKLLTMLTLLLGIAWMGATMAVLGMRLNFLNVVAFPITFGNGVDYGVNVMRRYAQEVEQGAEEPVRCALEESGGAVVLCSLTTIIAYTSLYTSANQALNSFGLAMSISEVTCVFAAMLAMPAALLLLEPARKA